MLIDRRGEVTEVIVGDAFKLDLPDIGRGRAADVRLRGLRLVHVHLKEEPLTRDDLTDLALLKLDLVCAIEARGDGLPGRCHVGWLSADEYGAAEGAELWRTRTFSDVHSIDFDVLHEVDEIEAAMARLVRTRDVAPEGRALLVGVATKGRKEADSSMAELKELARTAGVEVVDVFLQVRPQLDQRFVVGEGKLGDLNLRAMQLMVDVLIFDHDLTPSQARHLSDATSMKVIDRTQLILDIFAQRAQSADGKVQVELAQLKYRLPRLSGSAEGLSRLAGGIGGRGPGETKLEVDRRRVRERISQLEKRIEQLGRERQVRRQRRTREGLPVIAIVGYTNAGKSTLLNALTRSDVLAEDKLFATLDPTSRRLRFPQDREVIITDTVGFIRALPKTLVNAFRATLEELSDADLLLHVVDASDPEHERHAKAVTTVLTSLHLDDVPRLVVFNKIDRVDASLARTLAHAQNGVAVSATTREGFHELLEKAESLLWREGKVPTPQGAPFEKPMPSDELIGDLLSQP